MKTFPLFAFTGKLKSSFASCIAVPMLCLMLALTCAPLAGCNAANPATPKLTPLQIVQGINGKLPAIKAGIDLGSTIFDALEPVYATQVNGYVKQFDTLEGDLQTQVTAYLADPTADALTLVQNQVSALLSYANTSTLQALDIKDAVIQQKVLAWIKVISTGALLLFADIGPTMTASQLLHLRSRGDIHLARLRPYLDERELQRAADERGVDLDRSFKEAEAFGF